MWFLSHMHDMYVRRNVSIYLPTALVSVLIAVSCYLAYSGSMWWHVPLMALPFIVAAILSTRLWHMPWYATYRMMQRGMQSGYGEYLFVRCEHTTVLHGGKKNGPDLFLHALTLQEPGGRTHGTARVISRTALSPGDRLHALVMPEVLPALHANKHTVLQNGTHLVLLMNKLERVEPTVEVETHADDEA